MQSFFHKRFDDEILLHEKLRAKVLAGMFMVDTVRELGASHQMGWTVLIANLLQSLKKEVNIPEKKRTANFNHRVDFL